MEVSGNLGIIVMTSAVELSKITRHSPDLFESSEKGGGMARTPE